MSSFKPPNEVEYKYDHLVLRPHDPVELHQNSLLEILSWLSVKNICKLQCLNKSTCDLYSDPFLRRLQTLRARTDLGFFVHSTNSAFSSFEEFFLDGSSGVPPESIEFLLKRSKKIVASSNGLIVFQTVANCENKSFMRDLCVFNPILRALTPIFSPPGISLDDEAMVSVTCRSAGDGVEFDIILVTMKSGKHPHEWRTILDCYCYSSKTMSWEYLKQIDDTGRRNIDFENPVFVSGSIYWASNTGNYMKNTDPYVLAYNVEKSTSELMSLPEEARIVGIDDYRIQIAPWTDKSLCLIQCIKLRELEIWVMETPAPQGSWKKIYQVDFVSLGLGDACQTLGSFTIIKSDLLVFTTGDCLHVYSLIDMQMKMQRKHNKDLYPQLRPYVSTFHQCGQFEHKNIIDVV